VGVLSSVIHTGQSGIRAVERRGTVTRLPGVLLSLLPLLTAAPPPAPSAETTDEQQIRAMTETFCRKMVEGDLSILDEMFDPVARQRLLRHQRGSAHPGAAEAGLDGGRRRTTTSGGSCSPT
jgi:hypothetical protein